LAARPWPSLLLLGPTGSGKTPLGAEIERRGLGGGRCVHFDFGDNLRAIASDPRASGRLSAAEVETVRVSLATGALFEDRDMPMIVKIVKEFADKKGLGPGTLLVLNGLPRHEKQAEGLASIVDVRSVVNLEASAAVIRERMRLDPGGDRAARGDDTIEAVERRLKDFRRRTLPLVEHYRGLGVPVHVIPVAASMTAAEMYDVLASVSRSREGGRP
jgi:adenylate kinase family enzyme